MVVTPKKGFQTKRERLEGGIDRNGQEWGLNGQQGRTSRPLVILHLASLKSGWKLPTRQVCGEKNDRPL
jgi:hypothetical protein